LALFIFKAQQRKVGKRYILPLAKHCFAYFSLLSDFQLD